MVVSECLWVKGMTKREQKIRNNPRNVALSDFEWLIEQYGKIKHGGSHSMAKINGCPYPIPYKRSSPVIPDYVQRVLKAIDITNK